MGDGSREFRVRPGAKIGSCKSEEGAARARFAHLAAPYLVPTGIRNCRRVNVVRLAEAVPIGHASVMKKLVLFAFASFPEIQQKILGSSSPVPAYRQLAVQTHLEYRLPPVAIKQSVHILYLISPAK